MAILYFIRYDRGAAMLVIRMKTIVKPAIIILEKSNKEGIMGGEKESCSLSSL